MKILYRHYIRSKSVSHMELLGSINVLNCNKYNLSIKAIDIFFTNILCMFHDASLSLIAVSLIFSLKTIQNLICAQFPFTSKMYNLKAFL